MRLARPIIKLPWMFDADRLATEVSQFADTEWREIQNGSGEVLPLISKRGEDNNDLTGEMRPTARLARCGYLQQVLASFDMVLGRTRLVRLPAGANTAMHVDFSHHWHTRVRIHIPIKTAAEVIFSCGPEEINMGAGECWVFDTWRRHRFVNASQVQRLHLVIDSTGSATFWNVVRAMEQAMRDQQSHQAGILPYDIGRITSLRTERYGLNPVMPPGEMSALAEDLIADFQQHAPNDPALVVHYTELLRSLCADWRQAWSEHAENVAGLAHYQRLLQEARDKLRPDNRALLTSSNQIGVNPVIVQRILTPALHID